MNTSRSWPPAAHVNDQPWHVAELRPGDLVFCNKSDASDAITRVNLIAKQRWRHVGALIEQQGELYVVEIDRNRFAARPLDDFFAAYDLFGAARLALPPDEISRATARMEGRIGDPNIYACDDLVLAGLFCLTERGMIVNHRDLVRSALASAAAAATEARVRGGDDSFTCSNFIYWAYCLDDDDNCALEFDRWRTTTTWPPRVPTIDELLADDGPPLDTYRNMTLLELHDHEQRVDRTVGSLEVQPGQFSECARVLCAAILGSRPRNAPDQLKTAGRWVTPGDIWNSRTVSRRGPVPNPNE